jgi:hypothetical protein
MVKTRRALVPWIPGFVCVLLLSFLISFPGRAQVAGASLTGNIIDTQGAAIPSAKITATNVATHVSTSTTANGVGAYTITNLVPGDYTVTASAPGFSQTQATVTLTVGATQLMNLTLKVGQVVQVVRVGSAAPQVNLTSPTISATVNQHSIVELPLNGRDWAALAALQPGVASVRTQEVVTQPGGDLRGLGTQMTIGGNRPTQNVYRLNGIIINDYSNAAPGNVLGANVGVDAIQEFSVLTTNYSAQYGYTSGGVINAVTKSGTNQFHGDVYEFLRNSKLDAADFFENANGLGKGLFIRNQFGFSAGGPLLKNKLFLFGNYEGLRQSKSVPTIAHVLTADARLGILQDSKGNQLPPLVGACPYANSTNLAPGQAAICVDNTEAAFIKALMKLPTPGLPLVGPNVGKFSFDGKQTVTDNYETIRGDYTISSNDHLDGAWYQDHSTWGKPDAMDNVITGYTVPHNAYSLEESHVFSPALVNTIRLGYSVSNLGSPSLQALTPGATDKSFGIVQGLNAPGTASLAGSVGTAGLTNFGGFATSGGFFEWTGLIQFYDDAVRTIGNHNLMFGFMYLHDYHNFFDGAGNGSVSYSSFTNMLQNIPGHVRMPSVPPVVTPGNIIHHFRDNVYAGYLVDEWRFRRNLSFNLGLRYELATIPTETNPRFAPLPTIWTNPSSCVSVTDCSFRTNVFLSNPTSKDFMPRVGFSWDPFGTGKTAVRGGFGMFDVLPLPFMIGLNSLQTAPGGTEIDLNNPGQGTFPSGLLPLVTTAGTSPTKRWSFVDPNPRLNYMMQWNVNVQRQITEDLSLTVAYAGSRGIHNPFQTDELNTVMPYKTSAGWLFPNPIGSGCLPGTQLPTGGLDCTQTDLALGLPASFNDNPTKIVPGLLINPYTALIQSTIWQGQSWYRSLEVNVVKKMSHGLQLQSAFTWQQSLDTSSGSFAGDNYAADVTPTLPWWDLSLTKGPSDFNVGRNLVINALWTIPVSSSLSGPLSWVAKGWQVGGIVDLSDGVPLWPLDGIEGDPMGQLNGEPLAIPMLAAGCTPGNVINPGSVNYLKPTCFQNQTAPSQAFYNAAPPYGCDPAFAYPTCMNLLGTGPRTLKRNSIVGPGMFDMDFSAVKDFPINKISETFHAQFRAEFFNVLNHTNLAPPVNNLEAIDASGAPVPGFGEITGTQVPSREIQFALKLIW